MRIGSPFRIRTLLLAGLAASIWASSVYLLPFADDSQKPPMDVTGAPAQRFLTTAQKLHARELLPRRLESCSDSLRRARFEMNLQLAGLWGTRDFDRPTRLMDDAQRDAFRLCRELQAFQRGADASSRRAIEVADGLLTDARSLTDVGQKEASINARMATAAILLSQARAYRASGRFDLALKAAEDSREASAEAIRRSRQLLSRYDDPVHLRDWKGWIRQAVDDSERTGSVAFVVIKERHLLDVYKGGRRIRSYPVDLGANAVSQKMHAGDRSTPEGLYHITRKKGRGASKYYLALLLDYPNAEDRRRFAEAKEHGRITRRTGIGGLIEIHGEGGRGEDWTDGCVALSNDDMLVLYNEASIGTPVAIVGSDGGDGPVRSILKRAERFR